MPRRGDQALRVAFVHPTYWPEVRRGAERIIRGLAGHLARRGYEVTVLTGQRSRRRVTTENGFRVVRAWRPPLRLQPAGFEPYANHMPLAFIELARGNFDLVHVWHIPDAVAAAAWSRLTGRPMVLSLSGLPERERLDAYRGRKRMLLASASRAKAVHVLSRTARRALAEAASVEAVAIHPGVEIERFRVMAPPDPTPTILCAAAPGDPRKRVDDLVRAFGRLRGDVPSARLLIARGGAGERRLHDLRAPGVELIDADADGTSGLARLYARSWVSVLPSSREAFGQVLVESLAAGTPAIGMWDGAAPEILGSEVGLICRSRAPDDLASALRRGLDLGREPGVADRCRRHAAHWDWNRIGPLYEALYEDVACPAGAPG